MKEIKYDFGGGYEHAFYDFCPDSQDKVEGYAHYIYDTYLSKISVSEDTKNAIISALKKFADDYEFELDDNTDAEDYIKDYFQDDASAEYYGW